MSVKVSVLVCKLILLSVSICISFNSIGKQSRAEVAQQNWQQQLLLDVRELSSDKMRGRKAPSEGHQLAQEYIKQKFREFQLTPFSRFTDYEQPFTFGSKETVGKNLLGFVKGTEYPELYFVISAHYDHLGATKNRIYNGANDNASGVAAMLSILSYFKVHPPNFSFLFIATDAEESGLKGALHFIKNSPITSDQMVLNVNLDMLGDGGRRDILYMLASSKKAKFKQSLVNLADFANSLPLKLKWRKNSRFRRHSLTEDIDWREASDHAAFKKINVPYLYFGADTTGVYHTTKDDFNQLKQEFFIASASTIIKIVDYLQNLKPSELIENG